MSDQLAPRASLESQTLTHQTAVENSDEEFEEITSDEVDRVVAALDDLIEICQSENIKFFLEEAASSIFHLVYEQEEEISEAA
ncbi:MAG: hypothetical protein O2955_12960 [Planctomycetota bacterium]|nr:hypothetical protein [Planctomycetota bacterium]MDA1213419.1 hypothetical protein [Planctomycetota bacterium]